MQLSKTLLVVGFAASSVSAAVLLPRQSSNGSSSGPVVPTCTNPDPSCDVYNGLMVCVPTCYQISGGSNSGITINTGQPTTNCDINTLKCDDGKQLTGCYIQGSQASQSGNGIVGGQACGTPQGDGRDTGAAIPGSAAASSAIASQSAAQTASSSSTSADATSANVSSASPTSIVSTSAASTSVAANTAAAASASPSTKSNGAADLRPRAVGGLLAIGAFAGMLF